MGLIDTARLEQQAAHYKEQDDNQEKALQILTQLEQAYQDSHNYIGLAGVERSRFANYKHLFLKTNQNKYRELALKASENALQIALEHDAPTSHYYFGVGEALMLFGRYNKAAKYYQESLNHYAGTDTERGDFRYHLGEALYRAGNKADGKRFILEGLREISDHRDQVDPFLVHVWESGANLRLAELLLPDNSTEAKFYLKKAELIIESDSNLTIRRRQFTELAKKFS